VKKLKASPSTPCKAADRGARDASVPGPAERGVHRGKVARVSTPSGEVRQSAAGDDGTRLNIPFGNKELAMSLGARYRTGGWFAPPGTRLEPFQEKGWL
jgi:DNA topoisomerase-3